MAKRLSDTNKWRDSWFRKLQPRFKALWEYLRDECDAAGFWKVDIDYAIYHIGEGFTAEEALSALNDGKERIKNWGAYWEVLGFRDFQYGPLKPEVPPHRPVIGLLKKYELKGYWYPSNRVLDRGKEKEKEKEKEKKGGVGGNEKPFDKDAEFEAIWLKYPNKAGKSKAKEEFRKSVKTLDDLQAIGEALRRYLKHLDVNTWKSAQDGKTWFGNWRDWIDYLGEPDKRVGERKPPGLAEAERIRQLERDAAPPPHEFLAIRDKLAMKKAI